VKDTYTSLRELACILRVIARVGVVFSRAKYCDYCTL